MTLLADYFTIFLICVRLKDEPKNPIVIIRPRACDIHAQLDSLRGPSLLENRRELPSYIKIMYGFMDGSKQEHEHLM